MQPARTVVLSPEAVTDLRRLNSPTRERIMRKLHFYENHPDALALAKPLQHMAPATHRWRVGDYRLICAVNDGEIRILSIAHRRESYR